MSAAEDPQRPLPAPRHGSLEQMLWLSSLVAAVAVVCLGMLVIVGWHTGNRTLVQVLPAFVPMQYNTALGFICCGAALLLLVYARPGWAAVAGAAAALISGLTLVEYVAHIDLGIDELLMKHDITVETSHPGRMAPNSAICFLLTGLWAAVDLLNWRPTRRSLVQVVLASLVFGLAGVPLSGYLTGLETAYGWGNLTRMAVHTSAGFMAVSVGLIVLVWSRDLADQSRLPRWLPIPIAIAILTASLCFWQALVAEGLRVERLHEGVSALPNLATIMLLVGILLAVAMALVARLAQQATGRVRQLDQANAALQEEIATRQAAERALKAHRDKLEDLVTARTSELEQARRAAETANRAKSEFLSHMSHELRTPLNGILGYAQILQHDAQATPGQRDSLQAIVECGDHLLALINDVLDLSKIEAGRLEVDNAPCNLRDLIKGVAAIVAQRASRKGVRFQVDVAADLPPAIVTDAAKLRQVLVNLLGNAVKFTDAGQVTLTAGQAPAGILRLAVADTGVGMTAAEIEHIFDPFKQVEAGKAAGGTGLGLAISKRLVDAMGATLEVESEKGKGSTFSVTLPIVAASAADSLTMSDSATASAAEWTLAAGRDWTILVADDRVTNRNVLDGMLAAAGFKTLLATDGDEALTLLRTHTEIDLVLMDIRMPRVSGLEAIKDIRQDERLRHLKVIAVTASVLPEFRTQAIEAGFDDFLAKPFRVGQLMGLLNKHLDVEFTTAAVQSGMTPEAEVVHPGGDRPAGVPPETFERLRGALRIKNLTAIKAAAAELSAASATAALGDEIAKLAQAFRFEQLSSLLDDLEQDHGAD